jgi:DNA-binding transcriptional regulator PaaX
LFGGFALGMARSPKYQYCIVRGMIEGWKEINGEMIATSAADAHTWGGLHAKQLKQTVDSLYKSKLVSRTEHKDGLVTLVLTDHGRKRALRYHLGTLKVPVMKKWDGKWRIVMYDVPEEMRSLRLELYHTLRTLGFVELQHSVFAHPYECANEIEFLIETYNARKYVRRMLVEEIDISETLKKAFAQQAQLSQR